MVRVRIPAPLRPKAGNRPEVVLDAATLREAVEGVVKAHPDLAQHLLADDGSFHRFVNYFVNGTDARKLDGPDTRLAADDTVLVLPAVAGGGPERGGHGTQLSREELRFYGRHLILPEVGLRGQERLKRSSALVVGAGGLGAPTLLYLAAAGVGRIGVVDFDEVSASNLHRQVIYQAKDEGRPKAEAARERLEALNPHVEIVVHEERLTSENALDLLGGYDVVVDGTDNFPTRYLVNDACVLLGKPNVHASIFRFEGQASVFWAGHGPCYRCLYPQPPPPGLVPSCAEGGVLGVLPGILGVLQATEAVKLLLGAGEPLTGRLLLYDALAGTFDQVRIERDPDCPVCGDVPTITALIDYEEFCGITDQREQEQRMEIGVDELAQRRVGQDVTVVDVREPWEHDIVHIEGARLVPLGTLPDRVSELPQDQDVVVHCHSGARSAQAVAFLRSLGFARAYNLRGGIVDWVRRIEPDKPTY